MGTYYGGELEERNANFHPYDNGTKFYIVGETQSLTQIASENGLQPNKQVFDVPNGYIIDAYNVFVAHFEPEPLSIETVLQDNFSLSPNPNNGTFIIKFNRNSFDKANLELYDILGKKIHSQILIEFQSTIKVQNIEKGIYFVKITKNGQVLNSKIIVK